MANEIDPALWEGSEAAFSFAVQMKIMDTLLRFAKIRIGTKDKELIKAAESWNVADLQRGVAATSQVIEAFNTWRGVLVKELNNRKGCHGISLVL